MTINLIALPQELIEHVLNHCDILALQKVRQVCALLRCSVNDNEFAFQRAVVLYGQHFWARASTRPVVTSRPMKTMMDELIRLELFQRTVQRLEGRRFYNNEFYVMWSLIDKKRNRKHRR